MPCRRSTVILQHQSCFAAFTGSLQLDMRYQLYLLQLFLLLYSASPAIYEQKQCDSATPSFSNFSFLNYFVFFAKI